MVKGFELLTKIQMHNEDIAVSATRLCSVLGYRNIRYQVKPGYVPKDLRQGYMYKAYGRMSNTHFYLVCITQTNIGQFVPVLRLGICLGSTLMTPLMFGIPFPLRPSVLTSSGSREVFGDDWPFTTFFSTVTLVFLN